MRKCVHRLISWHTRSRVTLPSPSSRSSHKAMASSSARQQVDDYLRSDGKRTLLQIVGVSPINVLQEARLTTARELGGFTRKEQQRINSGRVREWDISLLCRVLLVQDVKLSLRHNQVDFVEKVRDLRNSWAHDEFETDAEINREMSAVIAVQRQVMAQIGPTPDEDHFNLGDLSLKDAVKLAGVAFVSVAAVAVAAALSSNDSSNGRPNSRSQSSTRGGNSSRSNVRAAPSEQKGTQKSNGGCDQQ